MEVWEVGALGGDMGKGAWDRRYLTLRVGRQLQRGKRSTLTQTAHNTPYMPSKSCKPQLLAQYRSDGGDVELSAGRHRHSSRRVLNLVDTAIGKTARWVQVSYHILARMQVTGGKSRDSGVEDSHTRCSSSMTRVSSEHQRST